MAEHTVYLGIQADSKAIANQQIADLETFLNKRLENISLTRVKDDFSTQDLGALLIAAFSAPAVVELAKGVADWMRKRNVIVVFSADGSSRYEGPADRVEQILRDIVLRTSH